MGWGRPVSKEELYFLTGMPVAAFSENLLHFPSQKG